MKKVHIYDRKTLYDEVWKEPMIIVSKRYGISNVALKRICVKLQIPTPGNGYWTIIKSGGEVKRPPLSKQNISNDSNSSLTKEPILKRNESNENIIFLNTQLSKIEKAYTFINTKQSSSRNHKLISEAKSMYRKTNSNKRISNVIFGIKVTVASLDRSFAIMNTIFKVIEKLGYNVTVEGHCVYVNIENEKIAIHLEEIFNKKINQSILRLIIDEPQASRKTWSDTNSFLIENRICEFILELFNTAENKKYMHKLESSYELQRMERYEEAKRFEELEKDAIDWHRSQIIDNYINAIERNIKDDPEKQFDLFEWIEWARRKSDWLNPLVNTTDPILGKRTLWHKFPL